MTKDRMRRQARLFLLPAVERPERLEIALRAEYFELRERRRIVASFGVGLILVVSWLAGSLLGVIL